MKIRKHKTVFSHLFVTIISLALNLRFLFYKQFSIFLVGFDNIRMYTKRGGIILVVAFFFDIIFVYLHNFKHAKNVGK